MITIRTNAANQKETSQFWFQESDFSSCYFLKHPNIDISHNVKFSFAMLRPSTQQDYGCSMGNGLYVGCQAEAAFIIGFRFLNAE